MAQWDTYRLSVVGVYDTVNVINSFYYQEVVTGNVGEGPLFSLFDAFENTLEAYVGTLNAGYQGTCITIRRLSPGITEAATFPFTDNGALGVPGLPATNYALMCYWVAPHISTQRNHFKFPAISEIMHQGGQFNNAAVTLYDAFWDEFTNPISADGYTFNPIRSRKPTDPILQPLPTVTRGSLTPNVRNTRGRNVYICTG